LGEVAIASGYEHMLTTQGHKHYIDSHESPKAVRNPLKNLSFFIEAHKLVY